MKDSSKTKQKLIEEMSFLKQRIKELELSETEGRHTVEALRRSEMKFRMLYDSTSDAVMLAGENGFFDCNKATLTIYGCSSRDEFCSRHPADLSPPVQPCGTDSMVLSRRHMATALKNGRYQFEWMHKRADTGKIFPAEVLLTSMVLDGKPVLQAVVRDITERKRAEAALKGSEETLRSMVNATNEALLLIDTEGTILIANKALARNLGKSIRELVGTSQYDHFPPDVAQQRRRQYDKVIRTGKSVRFEDEREGKFFEVFAYPVLDDEGKVSRITIFAQDITDRKRAEEALQESERKFKDLSEKSIAGVYLIQDGIFRYANLKVARILGYEIDEMIDKMALKDTVFSEDWPLVEENMRKRISGELESLQYEFRAITKNNEIKNIEVYGSQTIYQGKPAIIGTYLDITERKQMEDALRESEEKYRILVEKAKEAIIIAQDEVFVFANHTMSDLLGVPTGTLEGKPFIDFIWPEDRELVATNYSKRMAGETVSDVYDFRFIGPGGRPIWVFLSAAAIQWKGKPATLNLMTDITDRKRAEEALRESEQKFKDLSEKSVAGIYLIQDGIFRYVNLKLARILGYKIEEMIDKIAVKDVVFPEDLSVVEENMRKRISGELESLRYEFRVTTKNKEIKNTEVYSSRTTYLGKTAIIGTYLDITERKLAEEEKRHSEKLSAALEMAGAVCHELNQPLQVISGYVNLLSMTSKDDKMYKTLEIINDQVFRMGTITKKLMGLRKYSNRDYVGTIKITDIDQTPEDNTR